MYIYIHISIYVDRRRLCLQYYRSVQLRSKISKNRRLVLEILIANGYNMRLTLDFIDFMNLEAILNESINILFFTINIFKVNN